MISSSSNSFNSFISSLRDKILIGKVWKKNIENMEIYISSNLFLNKYFENTNIIFFLSLISLSLGYTTYQRTK